MAMANRHINFCVFVVRPEKLAVEGLSCRYMGKFLEHVEAFQIHFIFVTLSRLYI